MDGSESASLGFVDLQINGVRGVDFNAASLSDEQWQLALSALYADGTTHFLPTVITDSLESLETKLRRLANRCEASTRGKAGNRAIPLGIHLEGPFISKLPGFVGAHPPQHARVAELDALKKLVDAANGFLRIVTLAPECDPNAQAIRWLSDRGILVAAGHTDANIEQLKRAIDGGLTLFTHLGNGCPPLLHRHDNIVHRALALSAHLRYTFIADGHHLPYWLLASWVHQLGEDRVSIVSDAISAAGLPAGIHRLGDQCVNVGHDGVPRSEDGTHFVGSGMTLGCMAESLRTHLNWTEARIRQLLASNPSHWLQPSR